MLSRQEASIIAALLEAGTESNWPYVRDKVLEIGYSPEEIIAAWSKLEEMAGLRGTAVGLDDF